MNTQKKIVVAGNATIDRIVQAEFEIKGEGHDVIKLTNPHTGFSREFHVEDGPIIPGGKFRVREFLDEPSADFLHYDQTGGCGYNSISAISRLNELRSNVELTYLDISTPTGPVMKRLRRQGIRSYFLFERDIPYNVIVGAGRDDKVILKGPELGRLRINDDDKESLDMRIRGSDALLINSVKDHLFIETLLESMHRHNVAGFFAVTKNVDPEFVFRRYLPNGICFFNYDELPFLYGVSEATLTADDRLRFAKEKIEQMAADNISRGRPIVVTLSKEGTYYLQDGEVFHEKLTGKYQSQVAKSIRRNPGSTLGAGDTYFGVACAYHITRPEWSIGAIARRASVSALRHIGYNGELPAEAFSVKKVR